MLNIELLLQQSLLSGSLSAIGLSFLGGVVVSFFPCTIGMLPILVGYIGAYESKSKWDILIQCILFTFGIAAITTTLGILASILGMTFGSLIGDGFYYAIGAIAILMGLQLLDIIHLPLPQGISKLPETKKGRYLAPFLLGFAFGLTASPCGTPALLTILAFMSAQKNILLSALALFAYSVGQSILLITVGLFTGILKHMATLRRVGFVLNKASGVVFIIAGLLLFAQALNLLEVPIAFIKQWL